MNAAAAHHASQTPIEREFEEIRERYPSASMQQISGQWLVSVPDVQVPPGWSKSVVTLHFLVPAGYPHANPDCFYVDEDMRLANGSLPQNSALNPLAELGTYLWFSYHVSRPWKPGRDRLMTWVATCRGRLADLR